MKDAAGKLSRAARYRIERAGNAYRLELEIDREWLTSPKRKFPVDVDPTTSIGRETVCELASGPSADTGKCGSADMPVWVGNAGVTTHRVVADFYLSDQTKWIPKSAIVTEASVKASYKEGTPTPSAGIDAHESTRYFNSTATWNHAQKSASYSERWATPGGDVRAERESRTEIPLTTLPGAPVRFPVARVVQGWLDGSIEDRGVLLRAADEAQPHVDILENLHLDVNWTQRIGRSANYTYEQFANDTSVAVNVGNGNLLASGFDAQVWPTNTGGDVYPVSRHFNSLDVFARTSFGVNWRPNGLTEPLRLVKEPRSGDILFRGPTGVDGLYHRRPDGTFQSPTTYPDTTLAATADGTMTLKFDRTGELWKWDSRETPYLEYIRRSDGSFLRPSHDSPGRHVAYPGGRLDHTLDANGNLATLTETPNGRRWSYDIDATTNQLKTFTDSGKRTAYTYGPSNEIATITAPTGDLTRLTYDTNKRVTAVAVTRPGAAEEVTRFDYQAASAPCEPARPARHVGKTIVTAPDGTQRTYCPNARLHVADTWAPTPTPSGEWFDLRDQYVNGQSQHPITLAASDQGSGVTRLALEEVGAGEKASASTPCTQGSSSIIRNPLCPTRYQAAATVDARSLSEGRHDYRQTARDRAGNAAEARTWTVRVDRSSPNAPDGFSIDHFDPATGKASLSWDEPTDPMLIDGSVGSGVETIEVRWARASGSFGSWVTLSEPVLNVDQAQANESIRLEVRYVDAAGNRTATVASALTPTTDVLAQPLTELAPAVTGQVASGATLTTTKGTWSRHRTQTSTTDSFSYDYQWNACDVLGEECAPIPGAQASESTVTAGDVTARRSFYATVVATDRGMASDPAASNLIAPEVGTYRQEVLADNPSSYWRLGESLGATIASDEQNRISGRYVGSPTLGAAGVLGGDSNTAMSLAGNQDGVDFGQSYAFDGRSPFTAEVWVRAAQPVDASGSSCTPDPYASTCSHEYLFDKLVGNYGSDRRGWGISLRGDGRVEFQRWANNVGAANTSSTVLQPNATYLIQASYDGTSIRLRINGRQEDSDRASVGNLPMSEYPLLMGPTTVQSRLSAPYGGTLDEAALYPSAISAERARVHYAAARRPDARYSTGWRFGGSNRLIDTPDEAEGVAEAIGSAADGGSSLWNGIRPEERLYVQEEIGYGVGPASHASEELAGESTSSTESAAITRRFLEALLDPNQSSAATAAAAARAPACIASAQDPCACPTQGIPATEECQEQLICEIIGCIEDATVRTPAWWLQRVKQRPSNGQFYSTANRALRRQLGLAPPDRRGNRKGWAAHHIIAAYSRGAVYARLIAEKCSIHPNSSDKSGNGLYLRNSYRKTTEPGWQDLKTWQRSRAYHPTLHSQRYYSSVNLRLVKAINGRTCDTGRAARVMQNIREELKNNEFNYVEGT